MVTLHGKHIGSGMPWLGEGPRRGAQIVWTQLHVFAVDGDRPTEHLAVRDDLRVIEAVEGGS